MGCERGELTADEFRFGPFQLFPGRRELLRDGEKVRLGSRALDILVALVARRGEVVPADELIAAAWQDIFVSDTNLRVQIAALRKALGEDARSARFVLNLPGRGYSFAAAAEAAPDAAARPSVPASLASVLGRDEDLDLLMNQIRASRIVSIVGPGGIGKTTVALEMARRLAQEAPMLFVDLSTLSRADMILSAIAEQAGAAVAVPDRIEHLAAAIGGRPMVLVLDCCEHVIDGAAVAAETLSLRAPQLTILTTSREPLRVRGEWVYRLPPMGFPAEGEPVNARSAMGFPAVRLFVERVASSVGGYELADADAETVAGICRRLDGIALAIELAAGRVDALGIGGVAASLRDSFDGLKLGPRTASMRQRTLRATLDWSFRLLTDAQKRMLAALSVFNKEFTLPAARAVAADMDAAEVETCIADLVAKSLVDADRSIDPVRYRLLDMTRAHAREMLAAAGLDTLAAARHAAYYTRLAQGASDRFGVRVARLGRDIGNIRAALDWSFSTAGDGRLAVALTLATIPLWFQLSLVDECLGRVQQALHWLESRPRPDRASLMQLYAVLGFPHMHGTVGRPNGTGAWNRTLAIAREIGDVDYQLRAHWALWVDAENRGQPRLALSHAEQFGALAVRSADPADALIAERMRARTRHFIGDQAGALRRIRVMLDAYRPPVDGSHLSRFQYDQRIMARIVLARTLWLTGNAQAAVSEVESMIETAAAADHNLTLCNALADAACPVLLMAGDLDRAEHYIDMLLERTKDQALDVWFSYGRCYRGDLLMRRGEVEAGIALVRETDAQLAEAGFALFRTVFEAMVARGLAALGELEQAGVILDRAGRQCEESGEGWFAPELWRLRARLSASRGDRPGAQELLRKGAALADAQGALAWRAAIDRDLDSLPRGVHGI